MFFRGRQEIFNYLDSWVLIIGSRKATPEERGAAYALGKKMAERGMIVVSGLADGVDASAHQGALDAGGFSVGILANTPNDATYPKSNKILAEDIVEKGALIYPFSTQLRQDIIWGYNHFQRRLIERDLLQAALCKKIVAVSDNEEIRGGTRFAVNFGRTLNHSVFRMDTAGKFHENPKTKTSGTNWEVEINIIDREFVPWDKD
jgi:predicted Rossmann fold nucleotide-binding protein DprA/Smf involved in DNA uptake